MIRIVKQIELDKVIVKLRSDGIMQFDPKDIDEFLVDDLKEINQAAFDLGNGKAFPRLVVFDHFIQMGREIREYAATEESNKTTVAAAFVVNVLALKFIGNFYISFNKPVRPTKIFNSEEKAVEWLKSFL